MGPEKEEQASSPHRPCFLVPAARRVLTLRWMRRTWLRGQRGVEGGGARQEAGRDGSMLSRCRSRSHMHALPGGPDSAPASHSAEACGLPRATASRLPCGSPGASRVGRAHGYSATSHSFVAKVIPSVVVVTNLVRQLQTARHRRAARSEADLNVISDGCLPTGGL